MDRKIVYPGQIPLETDLLGTNQSTMVALCKLASAMFGTSTTAAGLAVSPTTPASLAVSVAHGEVYSLQPLEASAYSSLPADTTHSVVKQGILLDAVTLACPAPTTAGFSINYLIEAAYQDIDDTAVVLPFYNASNPSQAFSGPGGSGASSPTRRAGAVVLQAKPGIAATTGTQTTPSADAGAIGLAVVTVANGQTTITAASIAAVVSGSVMTNSLLGMINANSPGRLLNVQVFSTPGTFNYTPTPGTNSVVVEVQGAGGPGGNSQTTNTSQFCSAGGGGAGGHAKSRLTTGFAGVPVTVGAGAPAGSQINGGSSSFGSLLSATGGAPGAPGVASTSPGLTGGGGAGSGVGGNIENLSGTAGWFAQTISLSNLVSGSGGSSAKAAGAFYQAKAGAGFAGQSGSGGSGASSAGGSGGFNGGAGGNGSVIVWEYT